ADPGIAASKDSPADNQPASPVADDVSTSPEAKQPEQSDGDAKPAEANRGPVHVRVAKVRREDFVLKSVQMCSLVAARTVQLHARVSGIITRRNVELGDRVKKGDVLAEIDAPEVAEDVLIAQADADEAAAAQSQAEAGVKVAQATIAEARAAVVQRQAEIAASTAKIAQRKNSLTYSMRMREKGDKEPDIDEKQEAVKAAEADQRSVKISMTAAEANVSRAEAQHEAAKAGLQVARLRSRAAQRHLERIRQHTDYLQIRAPIDGAITEVSANVGSLTTAGGSEPLFMVSSMDTLTAIVELPQQDALRVKRGDTATVRFDALPGRTFNAAVSRMAYAFSPKTQTLRTEIDLSNPDGLLRPGMFGAAAIHLETHPNVLTIPRRSTFPDGKMRWCVYRVVNNRAVSTPVDIRAESEGAIEILGELAEGDVVIASVCISGDNYSVVAGLSIADSGLRDGAPVAIEQDGDE
ncbi:MAG TPA: efflux RND transporter periplasmic adaptor subunit, partial [Pirellulales bacterium]